jgi:hypothetical protein
MAARKGETRGIERVKLCTEDTECMRCNAWASQASVAFSNSFPIKLARNSENTSLIRFADPPFLCILRKMSAMGVRKISELRLVGQAGGRFAKETASSLASVFSKRLQYSRSESTLGFRGNKPILPPQCSRCPRWLNLN